MTAPLHVGLLVNPLAGLGGSLALKGSDGQQVRDMASHQLPGEGKRAQQRTIRALEAVGESLHLLRFSCWAGPMGEPALVAGGLELEAQEPPMYSDLLNLAYFLDESVAYSRLVLLRLSTYHPQHLAEIVLPMLQNQPNHPQLMYQDLQHQSNQDHLPISHQQ